MYFVFPKDTYDGVITSHVTATEFKQQFLAEKYAAGNPVRAMYILKNFKEEQIDLPDIPILEGFTNIMVRTTIEPSKIEINY